ncbi:MAG: hypothetical protein KC438_07495 [Thermomicrobiales bacterium]|nr:hypothetical protein [Thermomicrobiales bacterium]
MNKSGNSEERGIQIVDYEPWMKDQIVQLFSDEYGTDLADESAFFDRFYDHDFQRSRAIRLVAIEGRSVAGFQSVFYWPYRHGAHVYSSYQSGRSLVSPLHRGKGIFGRLLDHLDANRERYGCEFLMGFPVDASYGSFLRNGWVNPLDLSWFVRPLSPLALVTQPQMLELGREFIDQPRPVGFVDRPGAIELAEDPDFVSWRRQFLVKTTYRFFHYEEGDEAVRFDCLPNRRGRVSELIIGGIRRSTDSPDLLKRAFKALLHEARRSGAFAVASIAVNERCVTDPLLGIVRRCGFMKIRRKIHFITKNYARHPIVDDPSKWILFRSDIDTW